jgi:hypothetical protein
MLVCEAPIFEVMPDPLKVEPGPGGIGRVGVGVGTGVDRGALTGKAGAMRGLLTPLLLTEPVSVPMSCGLVPRINATPDVNLEPSMVNAR